MTIRINYSSKCLSLKSHTICLQPQISLKLVSLRKFMIFGIFFYYIFLSSFPSIHTRNSHDDVRLLKPDFNLSRQREKVFSLHLFEFDFSSLFSLISFSLRRNFEHKFLWLDWFQLKIQFRFQCNEKKITVLFLILILSECSV